MDNNLIRKGERLDDLNLGGLKLLQDPNQFCFGVDAVLLADFAAGAIKKDAAVMDMCSGNGIIAVLLTHKSSAKHITALEIQEGAASLAERSVRLNDLCSKVTVVNNDLKNAAEIFGKSIFDNVVCNPPYKQFGGGLINENSASAAARHEIFCTLEDVIRVSSELLAPGGKLSMIHRPERLADIIILMKKYKIEPKRLRFVHPSSGKTAAMILIEGAYCGRPWLKLEPPLYIYKENGHEYTDEINSIYERGR
ncbi:MAG TPA: tRNA1(Val) (adenine(37)-N6)-methyltransferase [Candidatus Monoglobus merdigallinarum]|uniref:tRNA1(Val) (Adenine(37)-N6)-methyltransferase n=1 Tax=Candidatus Monoglobus merdigallinarum TaxID=2838698 RepID=A0A9D1PQ80_9FIRM|nr:tRNA1(Val) (adenine(37)-N6)-methyltransferase [Candidatus Monoglobus merdigallinarum]